MQKLLTFFQQKFFVYAIFDYQNFNDIVSFQQLGPVLFFIFVKEVIRFQISQTG